MKEVIVNNIDVSGCEHYFTIGGKPLCGMESEYHEDCEKRSNCYYKQLKRKEQQYNCYACGTCKGKEDYKNLENHYKNLQKQSDKYEEALEEIKEYIIKDLAEEDNLDLEDFKETWSGFLSGKGKALHKIIHIVDKVLKGEQK